MDSIHKEVAIREWATFARDVVPALRREPAELSSRHLNTAMERNLAAFDMFVLHDQHGDIDEVGLGRPYVQHGELLTYTAPTSPYPVMLSNPYFQVSAILDNVAAEFKAANPKFDALSTRNKALTLNRWLRSRNLLSMESPGTNYRRLRNCFIGQALRHEPHESLPLISSVIYSSVAGRLGLNAQPCLFPGHVHAVITPPAGETLDGNPLTQTDVPPGSSSITPELAMHLDPYGNDDEVSLADLQSILSSYGYQTNTDLFLSPASPSNITMRTAHNIRAAFRSDLSGPHAPEPYAPASTASLPVSGASVLSRDAAIQAYLWARLTLLPPNDMEWVQTLHRLMDRFMNSWLGDVWLVERFLVPLYDAAGPGSQAWDDPRNMVLIKRQHDAAQPLEKRRVGRAKEVKFRVGQVVRHRRLDFVGVVTGWFDEGWRSGNEMTIRQLAENPGAKTVFYTCLYVFPSLAFAIAPFLSS